MARILSRPWLAPLLTLLLIQDSDIDRRPVEYTVSLPAPQTQMVEMSLRIPDVQGATIDVALPVWRPGRYAVLDAAGTVRDVRAFDGAGDPLDIRKVRKDVWRLTAAAPGDVLVTYRVYANSLADRTRHVDDTHAFLSPSSVFLYPLERRDDPILIHVEAPESWRIASGLDAVPGHPRTLRAADYDALVDSPIEVGEHTVIPFEVGGVPHEFALWGDVGPLVEDLAADATRIIEVQRDFWGGLPYERYVFLVHVGRGGGGGTEHLNSTIMQISRAGLEEADAYDRFLSLISHEFFHTWNVKRLRPADLVPYEYHDEDYTSLLWVAEGTTSYYQNLLLVRAGLLTPDDYLKKLGETIDAFQRLPGRHVQSLEESSFDAWIKFTKSTPDDSNATISFYSKGALVSLLLDLHIRHASGGSASLDDVLRAMYEQFPLEQGGYTREDLLRTIEATAGRDFDAFFDIFVSGTEELEYGPALATVGLELHFKTDDDDDDDGHDGDEDEEDDAAEPDTVSEEVPEAAVAADASQSIPLRADLGLTLSGTTVRTVKAGGTAYEAGILPGDELLAIDRRRIGSNPLPELLSDREPGEMVSLIFFRGDELREQSIALGSAPDGTWIIRRINAPTSEQKAEYERWLEQPWPDDGDEEGVVESTSTKGPDAATTAPR